MKTHDVTQPKKKIKYHLKKMKNRLGTPCVVSGGIRTTDLRQAEISVSEITLPLRLPRHCVQVRKIRCFTDKRGAVHCEVETYVRVLLWWCQVYSAKRELCKLIHSDPSSVWRKTINNQTSRCPESFVHIEIWLCPMFPLMTQNSEGLSKILKMWQVSDSRRNWIKFVVRGF